MSYLPKQYQKDKKLTEKQQKFLDAILETNGDIAEAGKLAGYSGNYHQPLKALKEEVIDLASDVLARSAPQAAFKLLEVLNSNKPIPQANNKLQAAQTILDRVGLARTDRVQVDHNVSGGIFILPEKETIEAEVANYEDIPD
jgi:hypothetical protein